MYVYIYIPGRDGGCPHAAIREDISGSFKALSIYKDIYIYIWKELYIYILYIKRATYI